MSPKGRITVVLADDTLIAREGWRRILETSEEIRVIGEAETTSQATKIASELKPQVILMDLLWFKDETAGWMAIKDIKKDSPEIRIIAITAYENLIRDARLAGADSALMKTFTRDQLLTEIIDLATQPEHNSLQNNRSSSKEQLTERELQVLRFLVDGHSDREIAKLLDVAPMTAKNHIKNIMSKLNVKNRTSAILRAHELRLIN